MSAVYRLSSSCAILECSHCFVSCNNAFLCSVTPAVAYTSFPYDDTSIPNSNFVELRLVYISTLGRAVSSSPLHNTALLDASMTVAFSSGIIPTPQGRSVAIPKRGHQRRLKTGRSSPHYNRPYICTVDENHDYITLLVIKTNDELCRDESQLGGDRVPVFEAHSSTLLNSIAAPSVHPHFLEEDYSLGSNTMLAPLYENAFSQKNT
ncbi:uncharacterized protein BT62DRAFT_1013346 [Guyanagaster necrorhizus]|uniref:Uncharacterized protein n=1 Tax=Guyanagaster necrorhizus TaxID=856835 RepID=A0A9P8ALQ9_9AGAR|nr:uncharacterized protein BT62DRAFT_1013346 [Guyanagaster necrorhizus MCA 3950]KAG7439896.1 hypothetical protein BT62DRAFT_1013346 [Guyanagaster necrorhizus MCA 3950]